MKRIGIRLLAVVMVAGMVGCATSSPSVSSGAKKVQDSDLSKLGNCAFLGEVVGSAEIGSGDVATSLENAKNAAREKAALIGASHIFWASESKGYTSTAHGKAYLCK